MYRIVIVLLAVVCMRQQHKHILCTGIIILISLPDLCSNNNDHVFKCIISLSRETTNMFYTNYQNYKDTQVIIILNFIC